MTALPVPEDRPGEPDAFSPRLGVGNEQESPPLLLSGAERTQEALTAAAISLEFGRIVGAGDARRAARYAARVVDNSRALCGGNSRLHLSLLVSHRDWMRTLPSGCGELR